MVSYKTGKRPHGSKSGIIVPDLMIEMKPFFDSMYGSYKEECVQAVETMEYSGVKCVHVPASLAIQTALSVIQTEVNPFFPRAGIISITFLILISRSSIWSNF